MRSFDTRIFQQIALIKLLLFLGIFMNASWVVAQEYHPMAVDSATWYMGSTAEDPQYNQSIVLRLEGDTTVNNMVYAKIYHYDLVGKQVSLKTRKLLGLIRDDLPSRRVYGGLLGGIQYGFDHFLDEENQCDWGDQMTFNEHLLYDFNLQVGDTIHSCMLPEPALIALIDTIDRFGYIRRNFSLEDKDFTIMTESIGTCMGIFKSEECLVHASGFEYLLLNYCVGSFSACNLITSLHVTHPIQEFVVYPNPTSHQLSIQSSFEFVRLELLDMHGAVRATYPFVHSIDISGLPAGFYILKFEGARGETHFCKVVRQ